MATPHPIPSDPRFQNLTGQRFGRLTVLAFVGRVSHTWRWRCRCDCTRETTVRATDLRTGRTRSCGCYKNEKTSERFTTHGHKRHGKTSKEYVTWRGMIARCTNANDLAYINYGGRGIHVCKRWLDSFEAFFADVGPAPSPSHEIDRYPDQNGGYTPTNVRWATVAEQARNKRNNRLLTLAGETMCVAAWAERTGLCYRTILRRKSLGWTDEQTLTRPVRGHGYKRQ